MKTEDLTPGEASIDALDHNIHTLCTHINAATYELLVMIREFDERAGWLQWTFKSCAEWLAWRCDLSMTTAREKVRVAHALKTLPAISESFASGELSYAKVRELTRVADLENEQALLDFALRTTATNVADRCRELRNGGPLSTDTAARAFANRSLRIRRDQGRGMMTITVDLPMDSGELVEKALDKARDDESPVAPDLENASWSARQADAFVNMAKASLSGEANTSTHLVTIHVDQTALAGEGGRAGLPIESVKRLCCDSHAIVIGEDSEGQPLSIGRKSRVIPKAIERAVRSRDRDCCTFPGCSNSRFLHCHHVEHWSNGGETAVDNLLLLCARHHTLVHEGGFRIEKDYADKWCFVKPDGVAVPENGYVPRLNQNPPAGGLLGGRKNIVSEPDPSRYLH
jgi:hypothetical protein